MAISPYVQRIRGVVGHELLLLPAVTVLLRDGSGRILLVRQSNPPGWGTIGGSIEIDESPADAARREAREEAGVEIELGPVIAVQGGRDFRVRYGTGDLVSYVTIVYAATVVCGEPQPDGDETLETRWFTGEELRGLDVTSFARTQLRDLGLL